MAGKPGQPAFSPVYEAEMQHLAALIARGRLSAKGVAYDPETERRVLDAQLRQLEAYAHPSNLPTGDRPIEDLSPQTAWEVSSMLRRLLNSESVPTLEAARNKSPHRRRLDADDSLYAMAMYVRAARGLKDAHAESEAALLKAAIADVKPVQTVMHAYGINSQRQVRLYLDEQGDIDPTYAYANVETVEDKAHMIRVGMEVGARAWRATKSAKSAAVEAACHDVSDDGE